MPLILRRTLYLAALALATPAAAPSFGAPLEASFARGAMAALEVGSGEAAPDVAFLREDGTEGRLSDYTGQVVVLNFWATWCAPCREEMPSLQALQDTLRPDGLTVVTIAYGRHAWPAMTRFWQAAGVTSLPLHLDADASLAGALGVTALPHTLLLDREGRVAGRLAGAAGWASPEALAALRRLLD